MSGTADKPDNIQFFFFFDERRRSYLAAEFSTLA